MVHDSKSLKEEKNRCNYNSEANLCPLEDESPGAGLCPPLSGWSSGCPQPSSPMHHRPWSRARSLLAAVMVRFRVCPNLAGGPARTSRGDLTSVRLSGRPHPQPGPPVSSSLSWVDSCSPTKRTLDRTQPGDTGLLVSHGCRSFFGFCFGLHVFSPRGGSFQTAAQRGGRRGVSLCLLPGVDHHWPSDWGRPPD